MTKEEPTSKTVHIAGFDRLHDWKYMPETHSISKKFSFKDYTAAFAFVSHVSMMAERLNHHPDIRFGWGYVIISLTTHDAGTITERDILLAGNIDGII